MKTIIRVLASTICCAMLTSCVTPAQRQKNVNDLFSQWGDENIRQQQALGERTYDKDFDVVFSAIVTGFSDTGLVIKNMERQSGYILAEGPDPLPENQQRPLAQEMCDELTKLSGQHWTPRLGITTYSATITVIRFGEHKTKVKMKYGPSQIHLNVTNLHYQMYPPLFEADYQFLWRALEKQIFLDENLDKVSK